MFALSSVDIDGVAEPADDRGFTFATYMSGSILDISGTPAQAAVMSGQTDVKAVVDQQIAQEIARLEAKIDAVISKRSSGRQANTASDNPELRLEDLSRQIAQLRKERLPGRWQPSSPGSQVDMQTAPAAMGMPALRTLAMLPAQPMDGASVVPGVPAGAFIGQKRSAAEMNGDQRRFRNASLGKKSNMGTGNGGKGVAKCCAACTAEQKAPVPVAGHACPYCSKCFRESKSFVLKKECVSETHKP
ncbi:hypothetical protein WJX79_001772 [Trebouxia sp. C0005]